MNENEQKAGSVADQKSKITGDTQTVSPAIAITDAAEAAMPSILTVTLPL